MPTAQLANRLHILFVIIVIGIALYFYFIYREIRAYDQALRQMQQEIVLLKQSIQAPPAPSRGSPLPASPAGQIVTSADAGYEQDEDEDESVCIEEIKNILDHMSEGEDGIAEDDAAAAATEAGADKNRAPESEAEDSSTKRIDMGHTAERRRSRKQEEKAPEEDLLRLTPEELEQVKTEKLKRFLKSRGAETKGARKELIDRILTLAPN